ncbi:hypothetical protein ACXDF8_17235 [Mycolicibacterium sp. CBM1]
MGTAVLQQVDEGERMAEHQILVEPDSPLPVEVDAEQLATVERLADAVHEVQPSHLFVAGLGVELLSISYWHNRSSASR